MNTPSWREHPGLKKMNRQKLDWLETLAEQAARQKPDHILPFLLAANANAKKRGITFTDEETDVILCVLKEHMNPQEQKQIDSLRRMLMNMR